MLSSLDGYVICVFASATQGATVVSTLLFLTPPTTMFGVYLVLGTSVTLAGLVGLVISGVWVWLALAAVGRSSADRPSRKSRACLTVR